MQKDECDMNIDTLRVECADKDTYIVQFCTDQGENLFVHETLELKFKKKPPPQKKFEKMIAVPIKHAFPGVFHEKALGGAIHCLLSAIRPGESGSAEIPGICKRAYNQLHG